MDEHGRERGSKSAVPIKLSAWTPPLHGASRATGREGGRREALGRIHARVCVFRKIVFHLLVAKPGCFCGRLSQLCPHQWSDPSDARGMAWWQTWAPHDELMASFSASLDRLSTAVARGRSVWAAVTGPVGALIATLWRLGWECKSARYFSLP